MLTTGFPRFEGDLFGSFILPVARQLAESGVEVEVLAPHAPAAPGRERMSGIGVQRFRYAVPAGFQRVAYGGGIPTNLKTSWLARVLVPAFLFCFWWRALAVCRRADVVHCHWTITGLVGFLATRLSRRPLVLSVRGSDVLLLNSGLARALNRRIYRCMDAIVAVSRDIGDKLVAAGADASKIRVIYNGVDDRFTPCDKTAARRQLDLPISSHIVLFVGLLVPVKGIDDLIAAIGQLARGDLECVVVGDGPLRSSLQASAARLGGGERFLFPGLRPSDEIPVWLNAADVLVLPSHSEGRPNIVLEAQACGLPVVATRVGGTPELIRDGEDGLLVDDGSPHAIARALSRLLEDDDFRERMGRAARRRIENGDLTWRASAERVRELYSDLLAA